MDLSVVIAGGGCRTAWSVGFFEQIAADLPPPREWAGVSAGACMAVGLAAGRTAAMMECFLALATENRRNLYPERLFSDRPVFPHEVMYRRTVACALADGGFAALREAGPVRILLAYFSSETGILRTAWPAYREYRRRRKRGVLHGADVSPSGVGIEVVTAQELASPAAVEDAVLTSSATPLVTRLPRRGGRLYVDGGFVENVPVRALSDAGRGGKCLVLLTRQMVAERLPSSASRLYVAPDEAIPIAKWDYASPGKLAATYEMGRRDARRWRDRFQRWIESDAVAGAAG